MIASKCNIETAFKKLGIEKVDDSEIDTLCDQLIADNPAVIEEIRGGKVKAIGPLLGAARKLNPNINPGVVRENLLKKIGI